MTAKLNPFDNDDTFVVADITNLSEEGLGLNFRTNLPPSLCEGDIVVLTKIEGLPELNFLVGVEIKFKWIMSYNSSRATRSGCVFVNISPATIKQIKQFIHIQINQKLNHTESLHKSTISA